MRERGGDQLGEVVAVCRGAQWQDDFLVRLAQAPAGQLDFLLGRRDLAGTVWQAIPPHPAPLHWLMSLPAICGVAGTLLASAASAACLCSYFSAARCSVARVVRAPMSWLVTAAACVASLDRWRSRASASCSFSIASSLRAFSSSARVCAGRGTSQPSMMRIRTIPPKPRLVTAVRIAVSNGPPSLQGGGEPVNTA